MFLMNRKLLLCFVIILVINSFVGLSVPIGVEGYMEHEQAKAESPPTRGTTYEDLGLKSDDLLELRVAAKTGAYKGWQEVRDTNGGPGVVKDFFMGSKAAEFSSTFGAANNNHVRNIIVNHVRDAAKKRGVPLSPQQENYLVNVAYEEIQPTALERHAGALSGTARAAGEMVGIFAIAEKAGATLLKKAAPSLTKEGVFMASELYYGDTTAASARAFTASTMLFLPGTTGKLLKSKVLRPAVGAAKGWIERAPQIAGNSPLLKAYYRAILKKVGKKGVKISTKKAYMAMIVLGDNLGLSESEQEELGLKPGVEFYKFYQAPEDTWAEIPMGDEGYVYRKVVDADGQLRVFAKDKDGIIQRQVGDQWVKVGSNEPVNFGSEEDRYNQAPWGEWAPISAGYSGWKYRKVQEEGSEELVLYGIDPNGGLAKQNEDGSWVVVSQQDAIKTLDVIHIEDAARDERRQELLAKFENVDEELPTSEVSYNYDWEEHFGDESEDDELKYEVSDEGARLIYGGDTGGKPMVNVDGVLMSVTEYSRRHELKKGYAELKGLLTRPSEDLKYYYEWFISPGGKFQGKIRITSIDGETKTVTFSRPGTFLQVLGDVDDLGVPSYFYGSTISDTTKKLKTELADRGWSEEGKEDKQLAFVDQAAPTKDQPVAICAK